MEGLCGLRSPSLREIVLSDNNIVEAKELRKCSLPALTSLSLCNKKEINADANRVYEIEVLSES